MSQEKANKIGQLLQIPDFFNLAPQDQQKLLSEIDQNYQNNPAFFMNAGTFADLGKEEQLQQMASHMPGFEQLNRGDQEDYYEELRNKYDFQRVANDQSFIGRIKNKVSDIGSDIADVGRAAVHGDLSGVYQNLRPSEETKKTISKVGRPLIEAGAAAGGAVLGSTAGPAGTIAGGGLGYGIGHKGADILDQMLGLRTPGSVQDEVFGSAKDVVQGATMTAGEIVPAGKLARIIGSGAGYALAEEEGDVAEQLQGEKESGTVGQELKEAGGRFATGAAMGAAGEIAGSVLLPIYSNGKRMFRRIPKADVVAVGNKAGQQAAKIFKANTPEGEIWAKNVAEAEAIMKEMPGVQFTPGEATDSPNMLLMEQAAKRQAGEASVMMKEREAARQGGISQYKERYFGGEENIANVADAAEMRRQQFERGIETSQQAVESRVAERNPTMPFKTGENLIREIEQAKSPVRKKMNELEEGIGDVPIKLPGTATTIKELANRPDATPAERRAIQGLVGDIREIVGGGQITFKHARGINRTINDKIAANIQENPSVAYSMEQIKGALDADLAAGKGVGAGEAKDAYDAFNQYASEEWFGRFKKGAVEQATAKGKQETGLRMQNESIPSLFLSDTGSKDLVRAVGQPKAANIMDGHMAYLIDEGGRDASGRLVRAKIGRIVSKNKAALKNYGLYRKYKDINAVAQEAERAAQNAKEFERSALGKVLNTDPGKAVGVMLSGSDKAAKAREVIRYIGDDKAAQNGLKNAFADHIINKAETTVKNIDQSANMSTASFDRLIKEYDGALKEVYKDNPKQLKALQNIQKAVQIAARGKKSPIGAGSQTFEYFANTITGKVTEGFTSATAGQLSHKVAVIKDVLKKFKDKHNENVSKLLVRAMYDPNYATLFTDFTDGKITRRTFNAKINDLNEQTYFGGTVGKLEKMQQAEINWKKIAPAFAGAKTTQLEQ